MNLIARLRSEIVQDDAFIIFLGVSGLIAGAIFYWLMRSYEREEQFPGHEDDDGSSQDDDERSARNQTNDPRYVVPGKSASELRAARQADQAAAQVLYRVRQQRTEWPADEQARIDKLKQMSKDLRATAERDWRAQQSHNPEGQVTALHRDEDAIRDLLVRYVKPAIGFLRDCPPVHPVKTLSFLGGVPVVPPGWVWPFGRNTRRPLHFLGQIDIATLPQGTFKDRLPADGVLYFFFEHLDRHVRVPDGKSYRTNGKLGNAVQFYTGPTTLWRDANIPDEMPANPSWMLHWANSGVASYVPYTKWPVTPVLTRMFASDQAFLERQNNVQLDLSQRQDSSRKEFEAAWKRTHDDLTSAERARVFGPAPPPDQNGQTGMQFATQSGPEDLPNVWLAVDIFCGDLLQSITDRMPANGVSPDFRQRLTHIQNQATALIKRAREGDPMRRLPYDGSLAFRSFWQDAVALSTPNSPGGIRPFDYKYNLDAAVMEALFQSIAACLTHSKETAALVSPAQIDYFRRRLKPQKHWMDGYGTDTFQGEERWGDYGNILLLEIGDDPSLGLAEGSDHGAPFSLQFWIDPEDLANRRFEQTSVVLQYD